MDGYFRAKNQMPYREVRELELQEIEFVSEDEDNTILNHEKFKIRRGYPHRCPRCQALSLIILSDPYCPECGWDSLENLNQISIFKKGA